MKTVHLTPATLDQQLADLVSELRVAGRDGPVAVTFAGEDELVSPREAGDRLGFSRQHVTRLIEAGELPAQQMPGSTYWQIPVSAIVAFEQERHRARQEADAFSRSLDDVGAPLE